MLGAATLVDVLLVNLRERPPEYAALAATGWAGRHLGRLVVTEGVLVATAESVLGGAVAVAAGTVVLTEVALTIPVRRVLRLPLSSVLAGE